MRVAQVVCVYPPYKSGIGNVAQNYARIKGIDQTILTPDYGNFGDDKVNKIERLFPVLKFGNAALVPQLVKRLRNFDIVHLHYPFYGGTEMVFLSKILFGRQFKLIMHYHMDTGSLPWSKKIFSFSDKIILPSLINFSDVITCASLDYVKHSNLGKFYKKNNEKFFELPFGVDIGFFHPPKEKINSNIFNILFVGGLDKAHYFKGLDTLIRALEGIRKEGWMLNLVGTGDLEDEYKKQAVEAGLEGKINFLGKKTDKELAELYRKSDLFVLPSVNSHEAFGIVLLEAMASGIPVITSSLPGVRTVFEDGKQGLYFRPGDAEDLRDKIFSIMDFPEKSKIMGASGRVLVESKYDWNKIRDSLKKIYEGVHNK